MKEELEERNGIGQAEYPVVVHVACLGARGRFPALEQMKEDADGIRQVEGAIPVGVGPEETQPAGIETAIPIHVLAIEIEEDLDRIVSALGRRCPAWHRRSNHPR